jgi:hypothetical protein
MKFVGHKHYCPNVDRLVVYILLDLIELTPMHVGIDFNSLRRNQSAFSLGYRPERIAGHLFAKIQTRGEILSTMVYTSWSLLTGM